MSWPQEPFTFILPLDAEVGTEIVVENTSDELITIRSSGKETIVERRKAPRNPDGSIKDWKPPHPPCPNCGKPGPHFAPPSFGEAGFYTCEAETK